MRHLSVILILTIVICSCAKQGMPSGGPRDTDPPKPLAATPENGTLNFASEEFFVEFDEYVVLRDVENNILVSPPMRQKPEYRTKGKGVVVKIKDTLSPNTTYMFQFKDAIVDFNEGNALQSFDYVFSTGASLDSMTLGGRVLDAHTLTPRDATISLWLFTDSQYAALLQSYSDTSVTPPIPVYSSRADKEGAFHFNYIKPGDYHVVAAEDEDKNTRLGSDESTAFLDRTLTARGMADTATADTVVKVAPDTLYIFTPSNERQRLTSNGFTAAGKVLITSRQPLKAPVLKADGEPFRWALNARRDTLTVWTLREKCDSLTLSLYDPSGIDDTLTMRFRPKRGKIGNLNINQATPDKTGLSFGKTKVHFFDTLRLSFSTPLDTARCNVDSAARLTLLADSSYLFCPIVFDSNALSAFLLAPLRQGERYELVVPAKRFVDIYGNGNDTMRANFGVSKSEEYGNLNTTIVYGGDSPLIVELLNESGDVVASRVIMQSGPINFANLSPAKYRVRAIVDSNGNGKWDPGDFATQRQPERVVFYHKILDVRANWDFEETMTIP